MWARSRGVPLSAFTFISVLAVEQNNLFVMCFFYYKTLIKVCTENMVSHRSGSVNSRNDV